MSSADNVCLSEQSIISCFKCSYEIQNKQNYKCDNEHSRLQAYNHDQLMTDL